MDAAEPVEHLAVVELFGGGHGATEELRDVGSGHLGYNCLELLRPEATRAAVPRVGRPHDVVQAPRVIRETPDTRVEQEPDGVAEEWRPAEPLEQLVARHEQILGTAIAEQERQAQLAQLEGLAEQAVVISHDLELVADFERVLVFDQGALAFDGAGQAAITRYREIAGC